MQDSNLLGCLAEMAGNVLEDIGKEMMMSVVSGLMEGEWGAVRWRRGGGRRGPTPPGSSF